MGKTLGKGARHMFANIFNKKEKNESPEIRRARILNKKSRFDVVEAYKALRTNIIFTLPQKGCKKIIIASSFEAEGKSTNSLNLAITFAQNGSKVLLIDCDLRRPSQGKLLDMTSEKEGLSNLLVGLVPLENVIKKTEHENLEVIFAGSTSPNPAELLGSEAMEKLLEDLSEKYDYILLDTPPVNVVADTIILSRLADGVLLVVRQGITEKDSVSDAVSKLKFANAKLLGFILNGRMNKQSSSYAKYHRYYYNRSKYDNPY